MTMPAGIAYGMGERVQPDHAMPPPPLRHCWMGWALTRSQGSGDIA